MTHVGWKTGMQRKSVKRKAREKMVNETPRMSDHEAAPIKSLHFGCQKIVSLPNQIVAA